MVFSGEGVEESHEKNSHLDLLKALAKKCQKSGWLWHDSHNSQAARFSLRGELSALAATSADSD
jgi:hypothetical protein